LPDIFEEITRIRREGVEAALATVVSGEKGSPGKSGFRMLVYSNGRISGTVGGGLLEAQVREEALKCIIDKKSKLLEFTLDQEGADSIGTLCGGKIKIFIEPIQSISTLYVFGGGHIAVPLVQFAKALDFTVIIVDDRPEFSKKDRFPNADEVRVGDYIQVLKSIEFHENDYVVIITHGHEHDEEALKECLSKVKLPSYIGMIGSREKIATTYSHLKDHGIQEQLLRKVKAPIGLNIGAQTPAEIAISIAAEIVAHRHGRTDLINSKRSAVAPL